MSLFVDWPSLAPKSPIVDSRLGLRRNFLGLPQANQCFQILKELAFQSIDLRLDHDTETPRENVRHNGGERTPPSTPQKIEFNSPFYDKPKDSATQQER